MLATLPMLPLLLLSLLPLLPTSLGEPRYLWGDALRDDPNRPGPDGKPYPTQLVESLYRSGELGGSSRRVKRGRSLFPPTLDPQVVSDLLLSAQGGERRSPQARGRSMSDASSPGNTSINALADVKTAHDGTDSEEHKSSGAQKGSKSSEGCPAAPPAQLCPTKFNTTAPMWGTSLTSGKRVTIVQKFPDLLQQVIFHECTSASCDILQGSCKQTFTPYLFLVIPLGPVTLTGQDYVMVESGCACQPRYSPGTPYEAPPAQHFG